MLAIEIRDLHKRYGSRSVIEGLSLQVERGQIYGLLGPNGSGKTTTLSCALGLMRPTSGSCTVLGEPSKRLHRMAGRLGVVFDTAIALPGLTAKQNLAYVRRLLGHGRGRRAQEVLELVGLEHMGSSRARALSLGQRKRLAIAGALLGDPQLLVLDEPLSGLDTLGVRGMLSLFRRLSEEGVTLLLSSHRLHEMESVVTHAGILLGGTIVRAGALPELMDAGRGLHRLDVDDLERSAACIAALPGLELLGKTHSPAGHWELDVALAEFSIGELNRALVEAGVLVTRIDSRSESLQSVFERLVDAHTAENAQELSA